MRTSDAKLAAALREAGLEEMAARAEKGHWNEYFGDLPFPLTSLAEELAAVATKEALALRQRVIAGDFDATEEEAEEWGASPEGGAVFGELMKKAEDE